jgi:cytochrome c biogenesis protein CcdA
MEASMLTTLAAIAVVDALNPAPTLAVAYILSTPKALSRAVIFVTSAFVTRVVVGAVLVFLLGQQIDQIIEMMQSENVRFILQLGVGSLLLGAAVYWWKRPPRPERNHKDGRISRTKAGRDVGYGVTMTLIECLTAIPYIAGLGSVEQSSAPLLVGLLVLYNAIYHAPPIVLILAWRRSGRRCLDAIERASIVMRRMLADRRWAPVLATTGIALLAWTVRTGK